MAKKLTHFTLPLVVTSIRLDILGMSIATFIATFLPKSSARTHLIDALNELEVGNLPVWFFLAAPRAILLGDEEQIGPENIKRLEVALRAHGAARQPLGSLLLLSLVVKRLADDNVSDRIQGGTIYLAAMTGAPSLYSDRYNDSEVLRTLRNRGLRPNMPIDEIFAFIPPADSRA